MCNLLCAYILKCLEKPILSMKIEKYTLVNAANSFRYILTTPFCAITHIRTCMYKGI